MRTCIFWAEAMSRGLGLAAGQGCLIQRRASWGGPIASRVSRPCSRFIRLQGVGRLLPIGRSLALQPELGLITRGVVERLRAFGGIAVIRLRACKNSMPSTKTIDHSNFADK